MSVLTRVRRGKIAAPIKALVYGVEGVGKSTLGAGLPDPRFVCAESGTEQLDVARLPEPRAWGEVLQALDERLERMESTLRHPESTDDDD